MDTNNINNLFQSARDDGTISSQSLNALMVADVGAQIQNSLGMSVDDVTASEVMLVSILLDDSISMKNHKQAAIDGYNLFIDAINDSKQQSNVLVHTRFLNGKIFYPYTLIENAKRLDGRNYRLGGGTPLYEQSVVLLGTALAKSLEFYDNNTAYRTINLIITDGVNNGPGTADDVLPFVKDMLSFENHIVSAMGIDDGYTDFRQIFKKMGLKNEWILTSADTPSAIRQAFLLASQTAARMTQSVVQFKAGSAGGFGSP